MIIAIAIAVGLLLAVALFRTFFKGMDDFLECVRYYFTPDIISWFRGEWAEDWWGETKLLIYLAVCAGGGFLTWYWLTEWLGG